MIRSHFLFWILFFLVSMVSAQELSDRSVLLEWDSVASASLYEVELTGANNIHQTLETSKASYRLNLAPGNYQFRVRAKDRRGLVGPWSPPNQIEVKVALVRYLEPGLNWETLANTDQAMDVRFAWAPAAGAKEYLFIVESEDNKKIHEQKLTGTDLVIGIFPGSKYRWSVQSVSADGKVSDRIVWTFSILSQAMAKPKFKNIQSTFVRELEWTVDRYVDSVELQLYKYDVESQSWRQFGEPFISDKTAMTFPAEWSGGRYRIIAWSKKNGKTISEKAEQEFDVHDGDRSVLSEARFVLTDYLRRDRGLFVFSDYVISQVHYENLNPYLNSKSRFSALAGNLNVGAERLIAHNYGVRGFFGLGGLVIENKNYVLKGFALEGVARFQLTDLADSRGWIGMNYQEAPDVSISLTRSIYDVKKIGVYGLSFGGESWKAFSAEWGGKLQGNFVVPLAGHNSQNENVERTLGYQLGVLANYNFSPKYQLHFGYSFKEDLWRFKRSSNHSEQSTIKINGSYFKLEFRMEL